jgi:protein O-mannosyl-transferase
MALERGCGGVALVVLLAVVFQLLYVAYGNSLRGPFLFDDIEAIVGNPDLRTSFDPRVFFRDHSVSLHFDRRPVPGLVTWADYHLYGLNPYGYRFTNLLLHLLTACMAFPVILRFATRFGCRYPRLLAASCCTMWVLHPLATNTVSFIFQRNELLMSLFYVLALLGLTSLRGSRSWPKEIGVICCAVLSALSKETGLTFLVVAPLLERLAYFDSFRALFVARVRLYGLLAAVFGILVAWIASGVRMHELGPQGVFWETPWGYFKFQCSALLKYLRLVIWPSSMNFFSLPIEWGAPTRWLPSLFGLCVLAAAVLVAGRRRKWVWACALVFFGILAPTSSVLPIPLEPYAEFRMYLPSLVALVPIVVAGGALLERLLRELPPKTATLGVGAVLALVAITLVIVTRNRNRVYTSSILLWEDVVKQEPMNGKALANLGIAHLNSGQIGQAETCGRILQSMGSAWGAADVVLAGRRLVALAHLEGRNPSAGLDTLRELAEKQPGEKTAQVEYARALARSGKISEADHIAATGLSGEGHDPGVRLLKAELAIRGKRAAEAELLLSELEKQFGRSRELLKLRELSRSVTVDDPLE